MAPLPYAPADCQQVSTAYRSFTSMIYFMGDGCELYVAFLFRRVHQGLVYICLVYIWVLAGLLGQCVGDDWCFGDRCDQFGSCACKFITSTSHGQIDPCHQSDATKAMFIRPCHQSDVHSAVPSGVDLGSDFKGTPYKECRMGNGTIGCENDGYCQRSASHHHRSSSSSFIIMSSPSSSSS